MNLSFYKILKFLKIKNTKAVKVEFSELVKLLNCLTYMTESSVSYNIFPNRIRFLNILYCNSSLTH